MRCAFEGSEGCAVETPVMFHMKQFGRKTTVPCCSACWRILTAGAKPLPPPKPQRMPVPQRERKPPPAPPKRTIDEDLFG